MELWGVKETREMLRKISGPRSVELMAEIPDEGLSILMNPISSKPDEKMKKSALIHKARELSSGDKLRRLMKNRGGA
jgi:hypothetical protein